MVFEILLMAFPRYPKHVNKYKFQIQVGNLVRIEDGDSFPCDLVLLSSSHPTGKANIMTANLDGETNLKVGTVKHRQKRRERERGRERETEKKMGWNSEEREREREEKPEKEEEREKKR